MEGVFEDETVVTSKTNSTQEVSTDEQPAIKTMTPAQKRLFELRLKRNQARKENLQQVVDEDTRQNEPANAEIKRAKAEYDENRAKEKEEMLNKGLDPEKEKVLNVTASEAHWRDSKKTQKEKNRDNSFGWDRKCN